MLNLLLTVMSIALIGMTTLISVNYINPALTMQKMEQMKLEKGFNSLQSSWDNYHEANKVSSWVCDTYTTTEGTYEDCQKEVIDPAYLPVSGWASNLTPSYGFLPPAIDGTAWAYGTNPDGWYFCAEGNITENQLKGVFRAQNSFGENQLLVSNTCGVTTGDTFETAPISDVKITYWVKRL